MMSLIIVFSQFVFADNLTGLCSLPGQQFNGITPKSFIEAKKQIDECKSKKPSIAFAFLNPDNKNEFIINCYLLNGFKNNDFSYSTLEELTSKGFAKTVISQPLVSVYNFTEKTAIVSAKPKNSFNELATACKKQEARNVSGTNKNRPCEDFGEQGFIAKAKTLNHFYFKQPSGGCKDLIARLETEQASVFDGDKLKPGTVGSESGVPGNFNSDGDKIQNAL